MTLEQERRLAEICGIYLGYHHGDMWCRLYTDRKFYSRIDLRWVNLSPELGPPSKLFWKSDHEAVAEWRNRGYPLP